MAFVQILLLPLTIGIRIITTTAPPFPASISIPVAAPAFSIPAISSHIESNKAYPGRKKNPINPPKTYTVVNELMVQRGYNITNAARQQRARKGFLTLNLSDKPGIITEPTIPPTIKNQLVQH